MLNKFCRYNNWANSLFLNTLADNSALVPESSILLFSHIVNAQTRWISRINGTIPSFGVWQLHDLETCRVLLEESANSLLQLEQMKNIDTQIIKYSTTTGVNFKTSVADILLHTFNHGTYHRAQIAKELKQHSIQPPSTDYVQFVRLHS